MTPYPWLFSCPTLWDPVGYSPPGSSVHGILQAGRLQLVAMTTFRRSSWPRDRTQVSCIRRQILYHLNLRGSPKSESVSCSVMSNSLWSMLCIFIHIHILYIFVWILKWIQAYTQYSRKNAFSMHCNSQWIINLATRWFCSILFMLCFKVMGSAFSFIFLFDILAWKSFRQTWK